MRLFCSKISKEKLAVCSQLSAVLNLEEIQTSDRLPLTANSQAFLQQNFELKTTEWQRKI
jgi:hypothetical protein